MEFSFAKVYDAVKPVMVVLSTIFADSFESQLIDYFGGHTVFWEAFGRFMLIRTK